jgi:hypothetical protein
LITIGTRTARSAVELRDQSRRRVEALDHLVVAAVRREADAFPAAERLAAEDQQRRARAECETLLEQRVQDVDLRLPALDRLDGVLDARCAAECGRRGGGRRRDLRDEGVLQLGHGLPDLRKERDGVDVRLYALEGGLELLVDRDTHVFDGRADLADHLLDRLAHLRVDGARDFLAPHRHQPLRLYESTRYPPACNPGGDY